MKKRIRAVPGGTSASKTFSIVMILIDLALIDEHQKLSSIVSESFPHLKRGAMRDFLNIMKGLNIYKDKDWNRTDSIYTFDTGSQIEFFSVDQSDKVRGARRDRLFINEANNVAFDAFEQLEVRTKDFVFLDWNPSSEFWYYEKVKNKRDDVEELVLTYKDNEALDKQIVDSIEQRRNRKNWWLVFGLGQLGEIEGRIYTNWKLIDEIPHEARLERYGLDFGYHPDPAVIVAVYYYNGGWILDEIVYRLEMSNREIANTFKSLEKETLVIADAAEPKSIAEINSYGINIIKCKKGKDSKKFGIKLVQDQPISITKRSVNGIKEYRNYLWKVNKDGNVIAGEAEDGNDHFLDACLVGGTLVLMADGSQKQLKDIKIGDYVKTQNSNNKVLDTGLTQKNANVYKIELNNGYKLKGTGDHKIFTNRGKVALDTISYDDIIEVLLTKKILLCKKQLFSIKKDLIGMANTIAKLADIGDCIKQSGNFITKKFQKDFVSIIKMEIEQIIQLVILNLKKGENINQNILKKIGKNQNIEKKLKKILIELDILQKNGTLLKKELNGIKNTPEEFIKIGKKLQEFAINAEKNTRLITLDKIDFATRIVKRKRCGQEDVYNLTVENEHNYYANGILVKNCRYALETLGRIKQEKNYWDRLYDGEFSQNKQPELVNPAR